MHPLASIFPLLIDLLQFYIQLILVNLLPHLLLADLHQFAGEFIWNGDHAFSFDRDHSGVI